MTAKELGDQLAYPAMTHIQRDRNDEKFECMTSGGLTKREEFAKGAMQAICSNERMIQTCIEIAIEDKTTPEAMVAERSVKFANALLAELAKGRAV